MKKMVLAGFVLSSFGLLGCGGLLMLAVGGPSSPEDKAWVDSFTKKYNGTVEATKTQSATAEAYFNALILATDCAHSSHGQLEEGWTVDTVDGKLRVGEAQPKCTQMGNSIRTKGSSEEACGYATVEVVGGTQRAGFTEWTSKVDVKVNDDVSERRPVYRARGDRQVVSCEKMPQKGNTPPPIWKKEYVKAAADACEDGTVVYTGTEWQIHNYTQDGNDYLERRLVAECWHGKKPVGATFSVPLACAKDGSVPELSRSCITTEGKLVVP